MAMKARYPIIEEIHMAPEPAWCFNAIANRPHSFFLDSGMDPGKLGRFSFMGSEPFLVLRSRGEEITLIQDGKEESKRGNPFEVLGELLDIYSLDRIKSDIPFVGGTVGYFSYDLGRLIERLPDIAVDDLQLPECYLAFYDAVVAYDHLGGRAYLISTGFPELEEKKRISKAGERLRELRNDILLSPPPPIEDSRFNANIKPASNFTHEDYLKAVATAREYIGAGDIFQVNLSQRFATELTVSPYELYRRLRRINPAPFANYFNFEGISVVGASPERF